MRLPQIPYMGLAGLVTIFSAGAHVPVASAVVNGNPGGVTAEVPAIGSRLLL